MSVIIRCENSTEEFYLINTYTDWGIKKILKTLKSLGYDAYEVIRSEKMNFLAAMKYSFDMREKNKYNFYIPNRRFDGRNRCFTNIQF